MTESKVTISLRVHPDLKTHLEMEAQDAGLSTSKYLESILNDRNLEEDSDELIQEYDESLDELQLDNFRLTKTVNELETTVEELTADNQRLQEVYDEQTNEMESLQQEVELLNETSEASSASSISFEPEAFATFQELMKELKEIYPDLSDQQLLMACLRATLKNEESWFFIHLVGESV